VQHTNTLRAEFVLSAKVGGTSVYVANVLLKLSFYLPSRRTIYPNLFCHKILRVSGNFFAHHQESPTYMKLTNAECTVGDS